MNGTEELRRLLSCDDFSVYNNYIYLELSHCNLVDLEPDVWELFLVALSKLPAQCTIYFDNNNLGAMSTSRWLSFAKALLKIPYLEKIGFEGNNLNLMSITNWTILCDLLSRINGLQELDLTANSLRKLSIELFMTLSNYFPKISFLNILDLSDNNLCDMQEYTGLELLLSRLPPLDKLILDGNGFGSMQPKTWRGFTKAIAKSQGIKTM